ncbi:MAG: membrane dipeptidase [Bacteroidota bacterium]
MRSVVIKNITSVVMVLLIFTPQSVFSQNLVPFVDFHNYAVKKAFGSRHTSSFSVWDNIEHDCSYRFNKEIVNFNLRAAKQSQASFSQMVRANMPFACVSYNSIEKGLLTAPVLKKEEIKGNLACVAGLLSVDAIAFTNDINYFADFVDYYNYLLRESLTSYTHLGKTYSFSLIDSGDALKESMKKPDDLGIVLTLSGGHMLGHSVFIESKITESKDYENMVLKNIARLKGTEPLFENTREFFRHPILYIGLASLYENGIVGSAQHYTKDMSRVMGAPTHIDQGFTKLGRKVVKSLLSNENGGRILVDVSGMSLQARQQYYQMIEEQQLIGERIPIVASHVGISGLSWSSSQYNEKDDTRKNERSYLNHWRKNLSAEDIIAIYESDGLIGISLNQYLCSGEQVTRDYNKTVPGSRQAREVHLKSILANIFKVVEVIGKRDAWDVISIGSDFDATMLPYPTYASAKDMPDLINDVYEFLYEPVNIFDLYSATDIKRMMWGLTPEIIVNKIFHENATNFVSTHLPDQPVVNQFNGNRN